VVRPAAVISLALAIGFASFLIRTVQPVGSSVLNFQLCFFAQYVVAFPLGVWVSRRNGLNDLANSSLARVAGWLALLLGPVALIVIAYFGQLSNASAQPIFGGWNWSALSYAVWEQLTGIGLGLGAMALCSRWFSVKGRVTGWLADHSFGVYLFHTPILVGIALMLKPVQAPPLVLAAILACTGLAISFCVAAVGKKTPLLKEIL
jgi:peptidoglycan/LPS O-acetylase OafA/YrhL